MANSLNNDLHLKHMALPQYDLPDDDDVELEDDSAETEPHRQPEAMPGWFKAALVLLALVLMSAAGAGYLYLTGDLSLGASDPSTPRSEEHTSELQSRGHLVCRLLLEKKNNKV